MKDLFIYKDFDPTSLPIKAKCEKSTYEVLVVAIFQKDGKAFQMKVFPVDLNVFGIMAQVFGARTKVFRELTKQLFSRLVEKILLQDDTEGAMTSLVVQCICCNTCALRIYSELPDQSIGFMLTFNVDDPFTSQLWGGTKVQVEDAFNKLINKKENK
jgi:hypothetical protein